MVAKRSMAKVNHDGGTTASGGIAFSVQKGPLGGFFWIFPVDYVVLVLPLLWRNLVRHPHGLLDKNAKIPGGKKRVESCQRLWLSARFYGPKKRFPKEFLSCHIFGCHGSFGPPKSACQKRTSGSGDVLSSLKKKSAQLSK